MDSKWVTGQISGEAEEDPGWSQIPEGMYGTPRILGVDQTGHKFVFICMGIQSDYPPEFVCQMPVSPQCRKLLNEIR